MDPIQYTITLLEWAAKNTAYNLDFIPDDKLGWNPVPGCKSALEIVAHVCGALRGMEPALRGGEWTMPQIETPTNRDAAKALLADSAAAYVDALRGLTPADFGRTVTIAGRFQMPMARAMGLPMVDLIHHHGQITYIQTLLGDQEFHFHEAAE
jgi:uncharacterized damage-inducible protein DinB